VGDQGSGADGVNPLDQIQLIQPGWRDALEIAIVAYALYRVLLLLHGTRALQIALGIVLLFASYAGAWLLKLGLVTYLLGIIFTYGAFALLVVFQPELRGALARLGQERLGRFFRRMEAGEVADAIGEAVERLSRSGIGAIIAIEREVPLGDYVQSGSAMEAKVSADLLTTIFTPYSPLHDGAVIIRGDAIIGAGCILPLSPTLLDDRSLGTRHRAALGLAEETDALVIVVSEETSAITVGTHGRLVRNIGPGQLRDLLSGRAPRTSAEHVVVELQA
jgi:diadenylate cyclase